MFSPNKGGKKKKNEFAGITKVDGATKAELTAGTWIWIEDDDFVCLPGLVKEAVGQKITLQYYDDDLQTPAYTNDDIVEKDAKELSGCTAADGSHLDGVDDMIHLGDFHLGAILHNLRVRHRKKIIYTNIGNILVAVNPYESLSLYTPEIMSRYIRANSEDLPPHIYTIAKNAYTLLCQQGTNQSIVISGESGAGKTETTKFILQFLAEYTSERAHGELSTVEQRILESNPILESFGNATTVRNNNSSRFGKWTELYFNSMGHICGAQISNYLLEKVRVVRPSPNERNYHIFYYLCAGARDRPSEFRELKLEGASAYKYLNSNGSLLEVPGIDDVEEFDHVLRALQLFHMTDEQRVDMFRVLAAILHLGNVAFEDAPGEGSKVRDDEEFTTACELFGWNKAEFEQAVCFRKIGQGTMMETSKPRTPVEAADARDGISKAIYQRLFDWIVHRLNRAIQKENKHGTDKFIGVLDIYGFEVMPHNSFEQLCINYANEKLQQHFNQYIFKEEQEAAKKERIDFTGVSYVDNQHTIDLFELQGGLFDSLDEQLLKNGTDQSYLVNITTNWRKRNEAFAVPPTQQDCFAVNHYAGEVVYDPKSFVEKNRDTIDLDILSLIVSGRPFLNELFRTEEDRAMFDQLQPNRRSGRLQQNASLSKRYQEQMRGLMEKIHSTTPHFVRCVKPNARKKPREMDQHLTAAQLKYAGFLEAIRIRRLGYPVRRPFRIFINRYRTIAAVAVAALSDPREQCLAILNAVQGLPVGPPNGAQAGIKTVFLKQAHTNALEEAREKAIRSHVIRLQSRGRRRACVFSFQMRLRVHRKITALLKTTETRDYSTMQTLMKEAKELSLENAGTQQLAALLKEFEACLQQVKAAKEEFDTDRLKEALAHADRLQLHTDVIAEGRTFLKQFQKLLVDLDKGLEESDLETLESALRLCRDLGYSNDKVKLAKTKRDSLMQEREAEAALRRAISSQKILEVKAAIEKAGELGYQSPTLDEARVVLAKLLQQERVKEALLEGIATRDLLKLTEFLEKGRALGMESNQTFKEAQTEASNLAREADLKRELKAAMETKDLEQLNKSINAAVESRLTSDDLVRAIAMRDDILRKSGVGDALQSAIASRDKGALQVAVDKAVELGVKNEQVSTAQALLATVIEEEACKGQIESAISSMDLDRLQRVVDTANRLGLTGERVTAAQQLLLGVAEVSKLIADATASRELAELEFALKRANEVGVSSQPHVVKAAELQRQVDREVKALNQLRLSTTNRERHAIESAMQECRRAGVSDDDPAMAKASQVCQQLDKESNATLLMHSAIAQRKLANMKEAWELVVSANLANSAEALSYQDLMRRVEEEERVVAALTGAIEAEDAVALDGALAVVEQLGVDRMVKEVAGFAPLLQLARSTKMRLQQKIKALEEIRLGVAERRRSILSKAISQAAIFLSDAQSSGNSEVVAAKALLEQLNREDEVVRSLRAAMAARNTELITASLTRATELSLANVVTYDDQREAVSEAQRMLAQLEQEQRVRQALTAALEAKDKAQLTALVPELETLQLKFELEKANAALHELDLQQTVGVRLERAIEQRDASELAEALKEARQRGMTGDLVNLGLTTKVQLDAEDQLRTAVIARDLKAISVAIESVHKLGIFPAELEHAIKLREQLQKMVDVNRDLKEALFKHLCSPAVPEVRALLDQAKALGMKTKEMESAQLIVIKHAQSERNIAELQQQLEDANKLGLDLTREDMVQAGKTLQRLREEHELKEKIRTAIDAGQIQQVEEYLQAASDLGIKDTDMETARRILSVFQKRTAGHAIKHWRYLLHKDKLEKAMAARDSAKLAAVLTAASRFVIGKPVQADATQMLKELQQQEDAASQLQTALEAHNIEALTSALAKCRSVGLDAAKLQAAEEELKQLHECEDARKRLVIAVESADEQSLVDALQDAEAQGVTEEVLAQAKAVLVHMQSERELVVNLRRASADKNLEELTRLLAADPAFLTGLKGQSLDVLESARTVHARLEVEHQCKHTLRRLSVANDKDALASAIAQADRLGVQGEEQEAARKQLAHLEGVGAVRMDLRMALVEMNLDRMREALARADELGMDTDDVALTRSFVVLADLQTAIEAQDQARLREVIELGERLSIPKDKIASARAVLDKVAARDNLIASVEAAAERRDVQALESLLAQAHKDGLSSNAHIQEGAVRLAAIHDENKCNEEARAAVASLSIDKLEAVLKRAQQLQWTSEAITDAEKTLELAHAQENARHTLNSAMERRERGEVESALSEARKVLAADAPLIGRAAALVDQLLAEEAVERDIGDAVAARDVERLRKCKARADELRMDTEDTRRCAAMLERVETELRACDALKQAVAQRDLDLLKSSLNDATQLQLQTHQPAISPVVEEALALQEKLWKEHECNNAMLSAIKQGSSAALEKALLTAEALNMAVPAETRESLTRLRFEETLRARLRTAAQRCEEAEIMVAIQAAEQHNATGNNEFAVAQQTLNSIRDKQHLKAQLKSAISQRKLDALTTGLTTAENIGLEAPEVDAAKELQATLVEEQRLLGELSEALQTGDLAPINAAIQGCIAFGIDEKTLASARTQVFELEEQARVRAKCQQAAAKMDLQMLEEAIAMADKLKSSNAPEIAEAVRVRQLLLEQNHTLDLLAQALARNDKASLQQVIAKAKTLEMENHEQVQLAVAALAKLNLEHRFFQAVDSENKRVVLEIMREAGAQGMNEQLQQWISSVRSRFERLVPQTVSSDATNNMALYFKPRITVDASALAIKKSFDRFPGWKPADEFVRKTLFRKTIEPNQKEWTSVPIPTSLLRINTAVAASKKSTTDFFQTSVEDELTHECTLVFKSILGFCGDKTYPFRSKLVDEIVKKGVENEAIRDEIYCQLFKQLTHNPSAESMGLCWQLLCVCSHSFPPSVPSRSEAAQDTLYPYLLYTLGVWQASENLFAEQIEYVMLNLQFWATSRARDEDVMRVSVNSACMSAIEETWKTSPITRHVHFLDGSAVKLGLMPTETAATVIARMARYCGLSLESSARCGVFETTNTMAPIRKLALQDNVFNLFQEWEQDTKKARAGQSNRLMFVLCDFPEADSAQQLAAGTASSHHLLHLVYAQTSVMVNMGILRKDETFCINLAALQIQIEFGECSHAVKDELVFLQRWPQFIPKWLVAAHPERLPVEWVDQIVEQYYRVTYKPSIHLDKAFYVSECSDLPLFGATLFQALLHDENNSSAPPQEGLIAVAQGVVFVLSKSYEVLFEAPALEFVTCKKDARFRCAKDDGATLSVEPHQEATFSIMELAFAAQAAAFGAE